MTGPSTEYDEAAWEALRESLEKQFGRKPGMQGILFLIGHRELGQLRTKFNKSDKQDLLHVAVCTLLAREGYYEFVSTDADGWPHFERNPSMPALKGDDQERLLKKLILAYFEAL